MTEQAAEFTFGSWKVPEIPFTIEYPLEVMDEIRGTVCDGLQQLSHGGLEVGGALFGTRKENTIRILTWRPILCEHAHGPGLRLSPRDRLELARLLEVAKADPDLKGLYPVGWFLSHARSDIFLSASDLEIYNGFFPEPWHVTLVLRPSRSGAARAGFFAREGSGALRSDSSHQDFTVEPIVRATAARQLPLPVQRDLRAPRPRPEPEPQDAAVMVYNPAPLTPFLKDKRRATWWRWLWAIPAGMALAIAVLLAKQLMPTPSLQSFSFRAYNTGETAQLEWDQNSAPIRMSQRGVLEVKEGGVTKRYPLVEEQLKRGMMTYLRQSGDLELRLTVYPSGHPAVQEFARLIGPVQVVAGPQLPQQQQAGVVAERDALAEKVKQLTDALRFEKARADRAQETLRILENRIAVDAARGQGPEVKK